MCSVFLFLFFRILLAVAFFSITVLNYAEIEQNNMFEGLSSLTFPLPRHYNSAFLLSHTLAFVESP